MKAFVLCFVPLFVAVDAVGILPLFMNLTAGLPGARLRGILLQSVLTASAVALVFVFLGSQLLRLLGISVADFMVAGGALLFLVSVSDLLGGAERRARAQDEMLGAVPLGVPLLAGPAVLTTSLLLVDQHGAGLTAAAVLVNMALAGLILRFAPAILRLLGSTGAKVFQRVTLLLLAAIAVMTMRRGIEQYLEIWRVAG